MAMSPVPGTTFATLFDRLGAREKREFVADLYATRWWDTGREDDVVRMSRDGRTHRIAVVQPGRFGAPSLPDVDAVVVARESVAIRSAADDAGVDYLTPDDLRDRLLYGLDRETAATLFEEHFDRPLSVAESSAGSEGGATPLASLRSSFDENVPRAGIVVGLLLVIAVWAAGVGLLPHAESENTSPVPSRRTRPRSRP